MTTSNFVDASRNVLANSLSSSTAIDVKESNLRISGVSVSAKAIDLNRIDGFGAAVYAEAADDVVFYDADTSTLKRESGTDFAVRLANSGLKAVSGRLLAATSSFGGISFDPGGLLGITGSHVPNVDFTGFGNSESFVRLQADGTLVQDTMDELRDEIFADVSGDATIAAGGVLTIAAGAVENSMLADDAVGADELAANAVVEASIVDNAVTLAKMAGITRGSIILVMLLVILLFLRKVLLPILFSPMELIRRMYQSPVTLQLLLAVLLPSLLVLLSTVCLLKILSLVKLLSVVLLSLKLIC